MYGQCQKCLFCNLDLQFQGHWWPLKGQILAIFSHSGPVLYKHLYLYKGQLSTQCHLFHENNFLVNGLYYCIFNIKIILEFYYLKLADMFLRWADS